MKDKLKSFLGGARVRVCVLMSALMALGMCSALAAEGDIDIASIMASAATSIVADTLNMVAVVLPILVTLLGASIAITYGIKFIKRITGKT